MSSCWKCGRDLPEGQVECDIACQKEATSPASPRSGVVPDNIVVQINLNMEAVTANPAKFEAVMVIFLTLLEQITMKSGLHEFAKPKPK